MTFDEYLELAVGTIGGTTVLLLIVGYIARAWIAERLKGAVSHEYATKLEQFKAELSAENTARLEGYKNTLKEAERINQQRWEMKRSVFLQALEIVDSWWSNIEWSGVQPDQQAKPAIDKVRSIHNQISLICESKEVLEAFEACLRFKKPHEERALSMDMIVDLRNAMRKELKFQEEIPASRSACWVAKMTVKE